MDVSPQPPESSPRGLPGLSKNAGSFWPQLRHLQSLQAPRRPKQRRRHGHAVVAVRRHPPAFHVARKDGHAVLRFIELDLDAHLGPFLLDRDTSVRFLVGQTVQAFERAGIFGKRCQRGKRWKQVWTIGQIGLEALGCPAITWTPSSVPASRQPPAATRP